MMHEVKREFLVANPHLTRLYNVLSGRLSYRPEDMLYHMGARAIDTSKENIDYFSYELDESGRLKSEERVKKRGRPSRKGGFQPGKSEFSHLWTEDFGFFTKENDEAIGEVDYLYMLGERCMEGPGISRFSTVAMLGGVSFELIRYDGMHKGLTTASVTFPEGSTSFDLSSNLLRPLRWIVGEEITGDSDYTDLGLAMVQAAPANL